MSSAAFQDHFSDAPADYAAYRPSYPAELYAWLASLAPATGLAWDCATGNGQAAVGLARHFARVVASDPACAQLSEATPAPRVAYAAFPAERAALPDASVDLVTVAQALHWFDHPRFYAEVRRVLRPGGVLAAWTYEMFRIEPRIDAVVEAWYRGPLDAHWPPERRHVEAGYRSIAFPFDAIAAPAFEMTLTWRLPELLGYLGTWSGTKRYSAAHGHDAVGLIAADLAHAWGPPEQPRRVTWAMPMLVGR